MVDKLLGTMYNVRRFLWGIEGRCGMKKIKGRRWLFHIRKSKRGHSKKRPRSLLRHPRHTDRNTDTLSVPRGFSITRNYDETIRFDNRLKSKILDLNGKDTLYIDFSNVEYVGMAALIYLLDLLDKVGTKNSGRVALIPPLEPKPMSRMQKSGLAGWIENVDELPEEWREGSSDVFPITVGTTVQNKEAGDACQWIREKYPGLTERDTEPIYEMLVELMLNTFSHSGETEGENKWYLYLEKIENEFHFIFLDAGIGIPKSVRKTLTEKIVVSDAFLLKSAFKGEYRTRTEELHRGKGLPQIANNLSLGSIRLGVVHSGKGCYKVDKRDSLDTGFNAKRMNKHLAGTLYHWIAVFKEGAQ